MSTLRRFATIICPYLNPTVALPAQQPVLFHYTRRPGWWTSAFVAYGVATGAAATGGLVLNDIWKYWKQPIPVEAPPATSKAGTSAPAQQVDPPTDVEWELRPAWQRGGLCVMGVMAYFSLALMAIGPRARTVRSLSILPPDATAKSRIRRIFIQCVHHKHDQGYLAPLDSIFIPNNKQTKDVIVEMKGTVGRVLLGFNRVHINGHEKSEGEVKEELLTILHSEAKSPKTARPKPKGPTWVSGPHAH